MTIEPTAWRPIPMNWLSVPGEALLWNGQHRYVILQPKQANYWRPGFTHWMPVPEGPK